MQIIDAQEHELGLNLDWNDNDVETQQKAQTELLLAWMDAVGVDATLLNPLNEAFGHAAMKLSPERFACFFSIRDPEADGIEDRVAHALETPGVVGLRASFGVTTADPTGAVAEAKFHAGAYDRLFAVCEQHHVPLFCGAYGFAKLIGVAAERYPGLTIIVDHMAIAQPPVNPRDVPPWKSLPSLLAIGKNPNVSVKVCGAPSLSDEGYPYNDAWPYLHQILEAFGADRMMWASDIGRFIFRLGWDNNLFPQGRGDYLGKHTHAESLFLFSKTDQISESEKELILGGTVRRLLGWPKKS